VETPTANSELEAENEDEEAAGKIRMVWDMFYDDCLFVLIKIA
jgi:hypothetical protein